MAHFNEDYRGDFRGDDRRRFGGMSRWAEDRREDDWRGESRGFERDRGREELGSRTYVAGGRGEERGFGEGSGRGYREDYGSGRFGGGIGADYDRGRFGRDYGEGYDRDRLGRDEGSRFGMGREDYGRGDTGRFGMGREDYGRGSYGMGDQGNYGQSSYGQSSYGQRGYGMGSSGTGMGSFGMGSSGMGNYGQSGYGMGSSDYRGMGRGSEDFRDRGELRRGAGEHEGRGAMDRLREGARRLMGKGPKSYRRSDERIRDDVNDRLMTSWMDAEDVEVTVKDGEVTLSGSVYTRDEKRGIEDLAEEVLGVKEVHNHLRTNRGSGGLNPQPGSATREAGTSSTGAGRGSMHS